MKYGLAAFYLAIGPGMSYWLGYPSDHLYLWGLVDGMMTMAAAVTLVRERK